MPGNPNQKLLDLFSNGRPRSLLRGQVLQTSLKHGFLAIITSGFIKRYLITRQGNLGIQAVYGPGDIFPLTAVFQVVFNQPIYKGNETFYYEAMSDSTIRALDPNVLKDQLKADPSLFSDLFFEAGRRLNSNILRVENITLPNSYLRLVHQLACFARQYGRKSPKGIVIDVPLTQQDLANILSVTRETVSLNMVELRKQKLVISNKHLLVPDLAKLESLIYG